MQILSVHSNYKIRGGEEESRELEENLLRRMNHDVGTYEDDNDRINTLNPADAAIRTIWSTEAYRAVSQKLAEQHYDLVHVQNFFPLISPSIYYAARARKVPVVQTLRNYRLLCPNALFFREGQVCEDCMGKFVPWPGVVHACYRESTAASAVTAAMLTTHRLFRTWTQQVNIYIALTEFARQKFIAGGFPEHKIVVKPNFVYPDPGQAAQKGTFALYVGRLSVEKGIDTLLTAWKSLGQHIPLKIVGEGPLRDQVIAACEQSSSIEWLGRKPLPEVYTLMGEAKLVILTSKWYETFGRVAVEAFAKGTPVIASKLGAIAEIVDHGRTGWHFQPANPDSLVDQVKEALANSGRLVEMGKAARAEFESKYTAEKNYQRLMEIYELALAKTLN